MKYKILVVDDDKAILKLLKRFLEERGFAVVMTDHGSEALLLAQESKPDLILTDVEVPGLDGFALCRVAKTETGDRIPVIIMSGAKTGEKDVLSGYEGGADDYLTKPFSFPILLAKIEAVIKRYATTPSQTALKIEKLGLELDPEGRTIKVDGQSVQLTRKEFDLLMLLVDKAPRVLSTNYLFETVWGLDPAKENNPRTVEVHISRLRKKLGPNVAKHIVNSTGYGYKFEE